MTIPAHSVSYFDQSRRRLLLAVPGSLTLGAPFALVACGGGGGTPAPAAPQGGGAQASVSITPASAQLQKGGTLTVNATATDPDNGTIIYSWRVVGDPAAIITETPFAVGLRSGLTFESNRSAVDVVTIPSTLGPLTVSVEAFSVRNGTRTSLGTGQCQITMLDVSPYITPATGTLRRVGGSMNFTFSTGSTLASLPPRQSYKYAWTCTSQVISLTSGGITTSATTQTIVSNSDTALCSVTNAASGGEIETIRCELYVEEAAQPPFTTVPSRVGNSLGTATAEVKIEQKFNIQLTPTVSDVPTDYDFPLQATIQESLPAGTQVQWSWLGGGIGSVTPAGGDANQRQSAATFRSSAEGTAYATISATVTPPGGPSVPVLPKSATLRVKRGLTEIKLRPSFGSFACSDPAACGVEEYAAFLIPVMPKAVNYRAVLTGWAFAGCNQTRSWNGVQSDRGGCSFPITYHPHSVSGPKTTWALWMGFGGANYVGPQGAVGQCEVTVTIAP